MRSMSLSHWEGEPSPPRGGRAAGSGWRSRRPPHGTTVGQFQEEAKAWAKAAQARSGGRAAPRSRALGKQGAGGAWRRGGGQPRRAAPRRTGPCEPLLVSQALELASLSATPFPRPPPSAAHPAQSYLASEEEHRRKLLRALGPEHRAGGLAVARAVSMLRRRDGLELGALLASVITQPVEHCARRLWGLGLGVWGVVGGLGGCGVVCFGGEWGLGVI
jgi:hypothetical protein